MRLADAYQIALDKTRSEPNAQVFDGDVKDSPVIRLTNEDKQYEEEDMLVSLFGDGEGTPALLNLSLQLFLSLLCF